MSGRAQSRARNQDRADDQHAAHGGRALFAAVQFRETMNLFRARESVDLFSARINFANDEIAEQKRDDESGHRGSYGPEGDVKENVEPVNWSLKRWR